VTVLDEAVAALRAGKPVVLPTDTVYGLCASADMERAVRRLYRLKGRSEAQPTALVAVDVDTLLECLPELRGRGAAIARAVLPGPYTIVLPNPERRYRWLCGQNPEAIGVRVPELPLSARTVVERAGPVAATSANLPGGSEPKRLTEVPEEIRAGCDALVDAGPLPGTPSTVIDFAGMQPRVLRQGAAPAEEALQRALTAWAGR